MTSEFEILRADLAKILYEATKDDPNIRYSFATTIKQAVSNGEEKVTVESSNSETETFDLLVAADGQWSSVRKQCFPPESVNVVDLNMYAVYFTIPRQPDDDDWWNIYGALGSRIITLRPDPHGSIRAMFTAVPLNDAHKQAWRKAGRSDRLTQESFLRKEFADAGWQAQRLLEEMPRAPDFYFHVIEQIRMSKWSNGRAICLGDAAYAPTPLTGAGTSLAIIGAYLLAAELNRLRPGEHPARALDAYEAVFRPFVEQTQRVPSIFPGIAHPRGAWQRWMLHRLLSGLSRLFATSYWAKGANNTAEDNDDGFKLPLYPDFI